jgi:hypothetical protein
MKKVFVDQYGHICDEQQKAYTVTISGSCYFSRVFDSWIYEIYHSNPKIFLKSLISKTKIEE